VNIPAWPQFDKNEMEMLNRVLASEQWGGFHPFVSEFESRFASYHQASEGISTFNGTVSLELALTVLGVGPGDEVIVPAISFISTATSVSRVGALPVFVDIEKHSFTIDPERVREAIGPRTKVVMPVHFGGALCRMDEIEKLCREHEIALVEDAAQAHGGEWNGRRAGNWGAFGSFSFQNGKVMCAGEGGMLLTSRPDLAEVARSIANQGRMAGRSFYEHHRLGTNFRITAFQAAVLLAQLEKLPAQIERRTKNAVRVRDALNEEIIWQTLPREITQHPFYLLLGRVRGGRAARDEFRRRITAAGVPCTPFYPHTLYQNPLYQNRGSCRVLPCPNAEEYLADAFWLPHRVLLSDDETMEEITALIREAAAAASTAT
jgi:dTDP-4-amino-4,6-dideoxygalactose transaminase